MIIELITLTLFLMFDKPAPCQFLHRPNVFRQSKRDLQIRKGLKSKATNLLKRESKLNECKKNYNSTFGTSLD